MSKNENEKEKNALSKTSFYFEECEDTNFLDFDKSDDPLTSPRLLCEMFQYDRTLNSWKEKSRLIKFEELVEHGGERWSKPHVSSLSMEAIYDFRKMLDNMIFMNNVKVINYKNFMETMMERMGKDLDLTEDQLEEVGKLLYKKHEHLKGRYKKLERENSSDISDKNLGNDLNFQSDDKQLLNITTMPTRPSMSDILTQLDNQSHSEKYEPDKKFARHIPKNCEAANVHIGDVDFLDEPITIWVRLPEATMLSETLTEVLIPTRFFVILLGPPDVHDYFEIGRIITSLLADDYFRPTAFSAMTLDDFIEGFEDYISLNTALPPRQWDRSIRIEPPNSLPPVILKRKPSKQSFVKDKEASEYTSKNKEHGDPTLVRSGRIFGGLIQDIKRKLPYYLSDFKDALHPQCLATIIFIYIACLSPIITFGGLQGAATDNNLAAMEGILSGALCGVIYVLFAGQPMTILGATGPMLVFETILFKLCKSLNWYFLSLRVWVGIWVSIFLLLLCAFDLSVYVTYITRFTEEAFATLICVIFIQQAISKLLSIQDDYKIKIDTLNVEKATCYCLPKPNITESSKSNFTTIGTTQGIYTTTKMSFENATTLLPPFLASEHDCHRMGGVSYGEGCNYVPNVYFFSILVFIMMFTIATVLKKFKNSPYFPSKVRQVVSDFSVIIGVIISVLVDWYFGLDTPKLLVPSKFRPTRKDRDWIIPFFKGNPWWTCLLAAVPALLGTILVFLDQQITSVIVNRKENKLKKGGGYHLDLFVLAIIIIICSVLGLPWFVAATVRAMTHVNSLRVESEAAAPGEKPEFFGVRENRVTMLIVSILIGVSVNLSTVFQMIPMPVLYGVFMYMGIGALNGLQLVDRCLLFFMPQKYQPEYNYIRKVKLWKIHLFTGIQVFCLSLLWAIKAVKITSIAFPLMILLICLVRKLLEKVFSQHELAALDNILPQPTEKKSGTKKKWHFRRLLKNHKEEV